MVYKGFTFLICDEGGLVPLAAVLRRLTSGGESVFPFIPVPFSPRMSHTLCGAGVPADAFMLSLACGINAAYLMSLRLKAGKVPDSEDYEKAAARLEEISKSADYDRIALVLDSDCGEWGEELAGLICGGVFLCGSSVSVKAVWDKASDDLRALMKGALLSEKSWSFLSKPPLAVIAAVPENLPEAEILPDLCIFGNTDGVKTGVINLPFMTDCNDTAPFLMSMDFSVSLINEPHEADECNIIIVPSSENPRGDLLFLEKRGFDIKLKELFGKKSVVAFGTGFSMLGTRFSFESGSEAGIFSGLGLGDYESVVRGGKRLACSKFRFSGEKWLFHPISISGEYLFAGIPFHGETASEPVRNLLQMPLKLKPDFSEYIIADRALSVLSEKCIVRNNIF
ncbi:hypothetical protein [Geovibrio thiophilus]|uniref:hypothetical protein n=1 Tax=Geovibrio thiophilus TaxID=139438 RepID=UPI0013E3339B|nr:hypothetical protein [Geovibrio thiophilus]